MSSGGGRRGREREKRPGFQATLSIVPSAQQQLPASQPLSRRNAQRGNPNTKVRMDGRAAFPCDCGPTREGMHPASLPASKGRTGHRAKGGGRADEARIG